MRWNELVAAIVLVGVAPGLSAWAGQADGKRPAPGRDQPVPEPDVEDLSTAEQSAWIDKTLPKLLAAMAGAPEIRAKIAGALPLEQDRSSFPLTPNAAGLAPGDLKRWSALVDAAVAANPRYGHGEKPKPRPSISVLPQTRIVRVETTYPAPPATKVLEPSPLTINTWVCPDRQTALALYWIRLWGERGLHPSPPDELAKSVARAPDFAKIESVNKDLGESSDWLHPGFQDAFPRTKADAPIPADRLSVLRGNVVVEATTVEFVWNKKEKKWLENLLRQCAPDVVAIMRSIDAGLVRFAKPDAPKTK